MSGSIRIFFYQYKIMKNLFFTKLLNPVYFLKKPTFCIQKQKVRTLKKQYLTLLSHYRDLNPRPLPYQGSALPLSYNGL